MYVITSHMKWNMSFVRPPYSFVQSLKQTKKKKIIKKKNCKKISNRKSEAYFSLLQFWTYRSLFTHFIITSRASKVDFLKPIPIRGCLMPKCVHFPDLIEWICNIIIWPAKHCFFFLLYFHIHSTECDTAENAIFISIQFKIITEIRIINERFFSITSTIII